MHLVDYEILSWLHSGKKKPLSTSEVLAGYGIMISASLESEG